MYDIYSNAQDDLWRFTLGKSASGKLLTIGLNPSTATQEKADVTVAKVEKAAELNGFDGFVMLNLYPVRATNYKALPRKPDRHAFESNLNRIEEIVASEKKPVIWAAWGSSIEYHSYFLEARNQLFTRLYKYKAEWLRFGDLTAGGHPRHPSRLNYAWKFAPYNITN